MSATPQSPNFPVDVRGGQRISVTRVGGTALRVDLEDGSFDNDALAAMPALTFKANPANAPGQPEDVSPTAAKQVLALDQVDNTSDADKVASGPIKTALDAAKSFTQDGTGAVARTLDSKVRDLARSPIEFDCLGDNFADDSANFQKGLDALAANGGGEYFIDPFRIYRLMSSVTIPQNVRVYGPWRNLGGQSAAQATAFDTFKGSIRLGPGAQINLAMNAAVEGLLILPTGMTFPQANASGFRSTPALVAQGNNVHVGHSLVIGFGHAFDSNGYDRPEIERLRFDCTAGIRIRACADVMKVRECHGWCYATYPNGHNAASKLWSPGTIPNGGSVSTTLTVVCGSDWPNVYGGFDSGPGVTAVPGGHTLTFAITGTNTVTATLTNNSGAPFTPAQATLYCAVQDLRRANRNGTAYEFSSQNDLGSCTDCFSFGWAIGYWVYNADIKLIGCTADNTGFRYDTAATLQPNNKGFVLGNGSSSVGLTKLIGCYSYSLDIHGEVNLPTGLVAQFTGCDGSAVKTGYNIVSGDAEIRGGTVSCAFAGSTGVAVTATASRVRIDTRIVNATTPISNTGGSPYIDWTSSSFGDRAAGSAVSTNLTIPSIAASDPLLLPPGAKMVKVTGTPGFGAVAGGAGGLEVTLLFASAGNAFHGGAGAGGMLLKSGATTAVGPGNPLKLLHNGVNWEQTN